MKLCIAEKPSVATEIAQIIGAKVRKDGYFEGNGYQVTWTFGHLFTLKTPDDYTTDWKKWNLNTLPMIPDKFDIKLIKNSGVSKQFKTIKSLVKSCDEVINCGDAGIEGELIQRWVLKKAECKKNVKRLWISSLTEEAIKEGFQNLKDGSDYDLLYEAGNSRAIGDWLLGMNATRLYTLKYANNRGVLSIGRVQTPTLALIVKRYNEIENFTPEKYWELKTVYRDTIFSSVKGKFKVKEEALKLIVKIKNSDFTINSFTKKKGKEQPPLLFDLTSLQVESNQKFGFTADNTLKTVQKLYERKFVSYPRVDTRYLPSDIYPKISSILNRLGSYKQFTAPLLNEKIKKSVRIFDDKKVTDHHAIIPTGVDPKSLSPAEQNIYDLITRRFIAAFYPDSIISNTTVIGEVSQIEFKATGKEIIEQGWRELYPKKESDSKKESQIIPEFVKGESGSHKPEVLGKETKPPKNYTEATLLRAMESAGKQVDDEELRLLMKENGIGRPSTRAGIIETLFKRNYIKREKKAIVAKETGIQLIGTIQNELLKSVELTGMWEGKLSQIEKGEYSSKTFLTEMKTMIETLVEEVKKETTGYISLPDKKKRKTTKSKTSTKTKTVTPSKNKTQSDEIICPKCKKGKIIKGNAAYGCSNFRSGCNFKVNFEIKGKKLTEKQIRTLIQKGKTTQISGFIIDGEKEKGYLEIDENYLPKFEISNKTSKDKPKKLICPICRKGVIIKGKKAYGCSRYRENCKFIIPFDILKSNFNTEILTDEILQKMIIK